MAAAREARNLPTPPQTFPLGEGTAAVFDAAADVDPALWAEAFRGQAKDAAYYDLLDRTMAEGFVYRYLRAARG